MKPGTILALTLFATASANAAVDSFIWFNGNDSNPCTKSSPCLTLQHAIDVTPPFGTVIALDPADSGPIVIQQPVTIRGNGSIITSTTSQPAITVVQPTGAAPFKISSFFDIFVQVELPSGPGVGITTQSDLHLENVTINVTGAPQGRGLVVDGSQGTVHVNANRVTTIGGNKGVHVVGGNLVLKDSAVKYANTGLYVESTATRGSVVWAKHSEHTFNLQTGITVDDTAGTGSILRLSEGNLITGNFIGTQTIGSGQILTLRDNDWAGNTTDGSTPFSLSKK